jgi:hypothetical protein
MQAQLRPVVLAACDLWSGGGSKNNFTPFIEIFDIGEEGLHGDDSVAGNVGC